MKTVNDWEINDVAGFRCSHGTAVRRIAVSGTDVVSRDPIHKTGANRHYLKGIGIRFAGKPLGRPKKVMEENQEALRQERAKRWEEYLQRIIIEGKFGQGKNGCRSYYIRAKRADTSVAWINNIFLVMNLQFLLRVFFMLCKTRVAMPHMVMEWIKNRLQCYREIHQTDGAAMCRIMAI
ncbi:MAG: transposase [Gammaproteobacteria bacterium]|nr:transposase [Gammaproteobacteria bacterium]